MSKSANVAEPKTRSLTHEHLEALAVGRDQGRIVRNYLEALDMNRPKRGRRRTVESIKRQIAKVDEQLKDANSIDRLRLIQQRYDLNNELKNREDASDKGSIEDAFISVAADYSRRKGIDRATWREAGVSPSVLRKAGI